LFGTGRLSDLPFTSSSSSTLALQSQLANFCKARGSQRSVALIVLQAPSRHLLLT
jgi:hypothetical protein